jgi:hypothetical protein
MAKPTISSSASVVATQQPSGSTDRKRVVRSIHRRETDAERGSISGSLTLLCRSPSS